MQTLYAKQQAFHPILGAYIASKFIIADLECSEGYTLAFGLF
jgi:hypothetical protein